jgi:hypothetical protein
MGNNRLCSTCLGRARSVDSLLILHVIITLLEEEWCEVAETLSLLGNTKKFALNKISPAEVFQDLYVLKLK